MSVFSYSYVKMQYPLKYVDEISKYSQEYNIPKDLLYAVIKTESGFNKDAKSSAGAIGLSQITPETFAWLQSKTGEKLETDDLYNPEISIKYSALFYKMLIKEFKNTDTAIAAYHAGRGRVNSWLSDKEISSDGKTLDKIPFKDTAHYVHKVNEAMAIYNILYSKEIKN
ncbi:MAG: lytic transglycosylase domain-containing protein [Oscillospiraceae bacterium]